MKIKKKYLPIILLTSTMLTGSTALAEKITRIEIFGNHRIENDTIINYTSLKKGDEFSSDKQAKAIKDLYATHLFDDISLCAGFTIED